MKRKLLIILISLFCLTLIVGIIGILIHFGFIKVPFFENNGLVDDINYSENYEVETIDAEQYFKENSTIIESYDVNSSQKTMTETEIISYLHERGFVAYPITFEYAMDGSYSEETEVSDGSSTKHPMYGTYYDNSNGEKWYISVIDGVILANPLSYNCAEDFSGIPIMISESEQFASYDSASNKIFKTIPNTSVIKIVTVNKIDSQTLDSLTNEVIKQK